MGSWMGLPPPEATVDAATFSEAEYPVFCLRCGYELRGLPDSRCPECGQAFVRGRLLVDQYVRGKRPRTDWRYRLARRVGWATWGLYFAPTASILAFTVLWKTSEDKVLGFLVHQAGDWLVRGLWTLLGLQIAGVSCGFVSAMLLLMVTPPRSKCRAVRNALPKRRRQPDAGG